MRQSGHDGADVLLIRRRATALRRVAFIVVAAGVASGTHWPNLRMGDPTHPADKLLHFVSFAVLGFFLHEARFFREHQSWRYLALFAIGIAWTSIDEISQQLPGLGRSFSLEDIVASSAGFIIATSLCWATRPRGSAGARLRRERLDLCVDAVLARPMGWMTVATSAALGAAVAVPLAVIINGYSDTPTPFQAAIVGGLLGAAAVGGAAMLTCIRREEAARYASGEWIELPSLSWPDVVRACALPILGGVAMLVAAFVAWALLLVLQRDVTLASNIFRWMESLSKGMESVIDATVVGLIVAVVLDRCRARATRRVDAADCHCLACGQDLRATPAPAGSGRCGECGAWFVRTEKM